MFTNLLDALRRHPNTVFDLEYEVNEKKDVHQWNVDLVDADTGDSIYHGLVVAGPKVSTAGAEAAINLRLIEALATLELRK